MHWSNVSCRELQGLLLRFSTKHSAAMGARDGVTLGDGDLDVELDGLGDGVELGERDGEDDAKADVLADGVELGVREGEGDTDDEGSVEAAAADGRGEVGKSERTALGEIICLGFSTETSSSFEPFDSATSSNASSRALQGTVPSSGDGSPGTKTGRSAPTNSLKPARSQSSGCFWQWS
jgi:hypothetical protein